MLTDQPLIPGDLAAVARALRGMAEGKPLPADSLRRAAASLERSAEALQEQQDGLELLDLDAAVQVAGPLRATGTATEGLSARCPALGSPFVPGRDGTAEECLAKHRRLLLLGARGEKPDVGAALAGLCERAADAARDGRALYLGYAGEAARAEAENVRRCVRWLLEQGTWAELPR